MQLTSAMLLSALRPPQASPCSIESIINPLESLRQARDEGIPRESEKVEWHPQDEGQHGHKAGEPLPRYT